MSVVRVRSQKISKLLYPYKVAENRFDLNYGLSTLHKDLPNAINMILRCLAYKTSQLDKTVVMEWTYAMSS